MPECCEMGRSVEGRGEGPEGGQRGDQILNGKI